MNFHGKGGDVHATDLVFPVLSHYLRDFDRFKEVSDYFKDEKDIGNTMRS